MIERIREEMGERGVDCLIITEEANFTWALGEDFSGYMFLTQGRKELILPRFYLYQAENYHVDFAFRRKDYEKLLKEKSERFVGEIRCDSKSEKLEEMFGAEETDLLDEMRKIKNPGEVERIREACGITDEALQNVREKLFTGIDEFEAASNIQSFYADQGVQDAFLTDGGQSLVQANSMKPHRPPEKRIIQPNDLVIVDSGCRYKHYCSDITRTYCENPSPDQKRLFQDVKDIQRKIIEMIEPGQPISELKDKEIEMAGRKGYNPERNILYFGHSIGVEVHEKPSISQDAEGELKEGMVLTVEPGLHVPDLGGVRLEDVVVVTENGHEVLSNTPKEL